VFDAPVLSELAARIEAASGATAASAPLARRQREAEPPLSFGQERLWFLDRLEPGSAAYSLPFALAFEGSLDPALLARSVAEVVRRHEVLRTTYAVTGEGRPFQVVADAVATPLPLVDLSSLPPARREAETRALAVAEARRPFDLARGPVLRLLLLARGAEDHVVLFNLHHIATDGWSMTILVAEVAQLYRALAAGLPSPRPAGSAGNGGSAGLAELPIQYADFAAWQREQLAGPLLAAQIEHWRRELDGAPATLELPSDRPRPAVQSFRGTTVAVHLPSALTHALRELGRRSGATLFMIVAAAFSTLLHRLSGQADVLLGTPIANRRRSETEGLIGFFVNTLVLRGRFADGGPLPFATVVARMRATALAAYAHQDVPFERLVEELKVERSLAHTPVFQAMLSFATEPGVLDLPDLSLRPLELVPEAAKLDLELALAEAGEALSGVLEISRDLFDTATGLRLAGQLAVLLEAAVAAPERPVALLPLLTAAERHQLLAEWSDAELAEPGWESFVARFARVAAQAPEAVAAVCEGRSLSYRELDRSSRRLAVDLVRRGVATESL
ncbi:MAG TPA: condensation domain-containing protein, partial [Thermoanaerobaculia bacterium]